MSTARLIAITVIIAIITDVPAASQSAQRNAVNLPMLIKLALVRETSSLERAVIQAQDAGRRYIYVASRVLGAKPDRTGVRQAVRKGPLGAPIHPLIQGACVRRRASLE